MKTWIKNNPKPDGTDYDLHRDGLKIYVTIDSRMQKYAEAAMKEHMSNLQRVFFKEQKRNKTAPFYKLDKNQIAVTMEQAMKRSNRWIRMKLNGASEKEIKDSFNKKTDRWYKENGDDYDNDLQNYIDFLEDENYKLRYMVENGLGEADLENDCL
jgi:penicillin-binding protein 1A